MLAALAALGPIGAALQWGRAARALPDMPVATPQRRVLTGFALPARPAALWQVEEFFAGYLRHKLERDCRGAPPSSTSSAERERWILQRHPVIERSNGLPGELLKLLNRHMNGAAGGRASLLALAQTLAPLPDVQHGSDSAAAAAAAGGASTP